MDYLQQQQLQQADIMRQRLAAVPDPRTAATLMQQKDIAFRGQEAALMRPPAGQVDPTVAAQLQLRAQMAQQAFARPPQPVTPGRAPTGVAPAPTVPNGVVPQARMQTPAPGVGVNPAAMAMAGANRALTNPGALQRNPIANANLQRRMLPGAMPKNPISMALNRAGQVQPRGFGQALQR
jgi:hypothetical protein